MGPNYLMIPSGIFYPKKSKKIRWKCAIAIRFSLLQSADGVEHHNQVKEKERQEVTTIYFDTPRIWRDVLATKGHLFFVNARA